MTTQHLTREKTNMELIKVYLLTFLYWLVVYFQPTLEFMLLVGFFVVMDTITGMAAAAKHEIELTSKKFRAIFPKFIVYGCAVLVAHVLQRQFFPDFPAMKIVAGFVAYSELMSIDENIQKITGFSVFKFFIKKLKK
jgi:phage-related holin